MKAVLWPHPHRSATAAAASLCCRIGAGGAALLQVAGPGRQGFLAHQHLALLAERVQGWVGEWMGGDGKPQQRQQGCKTSGAALLPRSALRCLLSSHRPG